MPSGLNPPWQNSEPGTPTLNSPDPLTPTKWWQALNPAIYLVSVLPGVAVWLLSPTVNAISTLAWATLAVVLLQHAVNLLNDVKDWALGADTHKYDSWVRIHSGGEAHALWHGLFSGALGVALGLAVLYGSDRLWIVAFAFPFVFLGILYNWGKTPLSYTSWGEWVTGICYGPGVFGALWFVYGQSFGWLTLLGMLAFGAFATALLFSHQPPQIETDRLAGKLSFAVRHGAEATYTAALWLFGMSLGLVAIALWISHHTMPSASAFSILSILSVLWVKRLGPNPKRIMLSAALVFLITSVFVISSQG